MRFYHIHISIQNGNATNLKFIPFENKCITLFHAGKVNIWFSRTPYTKAQTIAVVHCVKLIPYLLSILEFFPKENEKPHTHSKKRWFLSKCKQNTRILPNVIVLNPSAHSPTANILNKSTLTNSSGEREHSIMCSIIKDNTSSADKITFAPIFFPFYIHIHHLTLNYGRW